MNFNLSFFLAWHLDCNILRNLILVINKFQIVQLELLSVLSTFDHFIELKVVS